MRRRDFLGLSGVALTAAAWPFADRDWRALAQGTQRPRLSMPPLLDTRKTGKLSLVAQTGQTSFAGGPPNLTAGYNSGFMGPTIVMQNGALDARVENRLNEPVTSHWHGLLVPGHHDGGPHTPVEPGKAWADMMQLDQQPTTAWYHSHTHGATARHVYAGLAGVIHHTDGRDDDRGLPSTYGVDDLTLVIQDKRFDDAGKLVYTPDTTDILNGFHGERILVNGQFNSVAVVPRGIVRLRLLNGSNARIYSLHMSDRRPMYVIGNDGGFLGKPVELTFLRIAPGERFEVLVDFGQGAPPLLMNSSGISMKILEFATDDALKPRITRVPDTLGSGLAPLPEGNFPVRRISLTMGGGSSFELRNVSQLASGHGGHGGHTGHGPVLGAGPNGELGVVMTDFGINSRPYDVRRIDFQVKRGTHERWLVSGGGGVIHPFHVHGVHFRIVTTGGGAPQPEESGWKDTHPINGQLEIIVRFDHEAPREAPYMYHCHILEHEDSGMMGQFTVT